MGLTQSKQITRNHREDFRNIPNSFPEQRRNSDCEEFLSPSEKTLVSSTSRKLRNQDRLYNIRQNKKSKDEAESEEFLGEVTSESLSPKQHCLQMTSSGEMVNYPCI